MTKKYRATFNNYLNYLSYRLGRVRAWGKPSLYIVETTSRCNLRCPMCARQYLNREDEDMDSAMFKRIIDQTKYFSHPLWLYWMCEPLMDRNLAEKIRYCKTKGVRVGISTNAVLLTAARSKELLVSGLDTIMLCMDGATKETYEKMRAGADFQTVKKNISGFIRQNKQLGYNAKTVISMIKMKETESEVADFVKEWQNAGADKIVIKPFTTWGNDRIKSHAPKDWKFTQRIPCKVLWETLVVGVSGDVQPCSLIYNSDLVVGNVERQTLNEIWNGEPMKELRRLHLAKDIEGLPCKDCGC